MPGGEGRRTGHQERISKIESRVPQHQLHGAKRNVALDGAKKKRYQDGRNGRQ